MNKSVSAGQLLQLFFAHFRELIREPAVLFWGIGFPILMSLGLGIAFTKKADITMTVAIIKSNEQSVSTSDSSRFITSFLNKHARYFPGNSTDSGQYRIVIPDEKLGNTTFIFQMNTWEEGMTLLKRGHLSVLINEKDGHINYHFDPLNPTAQLYYLKLERLFNPGSPASPGRAAQIQPLTVSGSRYIDFLIPGLIAMGIMMSCMWGISYGIIEKRQQKLLRRMVATPMKKSFFLISLISVRVLMNFIESALLFIFAALVFDISIQGDVFALLLIFIAGNICFAGIAIFFSSHTARTETGNGLVNAVVMPMMILSGVFFSYQNFPDWAISIIKVLPLTLLADSMRGICIEGAGFQQAIFPILILSASGSIFFLAGLKIFKWH